MLYLARFPQGATHTSCTRRSHSDDATSRQIRSKVTPEGAVITVLCHGQAAWVTSCPAGKALWDSLGWRALRKLVALCIYIKLCVTLGEGHWRFVRYWKHKRLCIDLCREFSARNCSWATAALMVSVVSLGNVPVLAVWQKQSLEQTNEKSDEREPRPLPVCFPHLQGWAPNELLWNTVGLCFWK